MELLILNTELKTDNILDTFESLIWTDRYCSYGDFEIYVTASEDMLTYLREDYYLWLKESEHVMIIEGIAIKSDAEQGNHLIVTGRSLESILDRRIVWGQTVLTGSLQNGIKKLLDENLISPEISDRAIPNFVFELSTDPVITSLTVDAQFTWTNLYESVQKLCAANNIGFKVTLSDTNQFVFKLYQGVNRSYDQIINPYVIFSPNFGNIAGTNYSESKEGLKTVTLIAGEGEGLARKTTIVGSGVSISRREVYTDARDLSQTIDEVLVSDEEYLSHLEQRGAEALSEYIMSRSFDGQADTATLFKYNQDFFMGDIVQLVSEYGVEAKSRVVEITHSQSTSGMEIYPTFAMEDANTVETSGVLTPGGTSTFEETAANILSKIKTVDGPGSGLDADTVDGLHSSAFATAAQGVLAVNALPGSAYKIVSNQFSWGTLATATGWYKIKIKSLLGWMLFFKLNVYQDYTFFEANISGYNYGASHWYAPTALMVSKNTAARTIHFGYDPDLSLWVAFQAGAYTGISISNITNGYYQVTEAWQDAFIITLEAVLTGTIQTTFTI